MQVASESVTRTSVVAATLVGGRSLHTRKADQARALRGAGAGAYLDAEQIVAAAQAAGCDAIHPGYGFLSENAGFAQLCAGAGD